MNKLFMFSDFGADRVPAIDIWVNRIELWGYNPVKNVSKFCVIVKNL